MELSKMTMGQLAAALETEPNLVEGARLEVAREMRRRLNQIIQHDGDTVRAALRPKPVRNHPGTSSSVPRN